MKTYPITLDAADVTVFTHGLTGKGFFLPRGGGLVTGNRTQGLPDAGGTRTR